MIGRQHRSGSRASEGISPLPLDPIAPPAATGTVELRPARPLSLTPTPTAVEMAPRLGNLAQNARFPHSHSRLSWEGGEPTKAKDQDSTAGSLDTRPAIRAR